MAMKNVAAQASKKKSMRSLSHRSSKTTVTSSRRTHIMGTRIMAKAAMPIVARQIVPLSSKLQSLRTQQNASSWMDKIQNFQLQFPIYEVKDYYSNNSFLPSPKGACLSETEAESSRTVIMPAMMKGSTTLEEEIANMKAILEKLTRESEEKEACIKLQEKKIARLKGVYSSGT